MNINCLERKNQRTRHPPNHPPGLPDNRQKLIQLWRKNEKNDYRLKEYETNFPPEEIHSLLYYSTIFIGDSATMATEAGLLGTPSIYISTFKGSLGNFIELEEKYKLVYSFKNELEAMKKIDEIISNSESKKIWEERKEFMLKNTIDVNEFLYDQIISTQI